MKKRMKLIGIALSVAGVLGIIFGGVALAAGPTGAANSTVAGFCGNGWGASEFGSIDVVSKLLGLTPEQIQVERQAGKSLVEIAATKNISEDTLIKAITAAKTETVQARVTAGTLTQEQATLMLQQMEQRTKTMVERKIVGPPEWRGSGDCGLGTGQGNGCGMMGGGRKAQNNAASGFRMGGGMMGRWGNTN